MNRLDAIYSLWEDLDKSYEKKGNGIPRLEFIKQLLNYDAGEAAMRSLLQVVHDSAGDEIEKAERLCQWIQNTAENLGVLQGTQKAVVNLNSLKDNHISAQNFTPDDMNLFINRPALDVFVARKEHSVLPIRRAIPVNGVYKLDAFEYEGCMMAENPNECLRLIQLLLDSGLTGEAQYLLEFVKQDNLLYPLILCDRPAFDVLRYVGKCKPIDTKMRHYEIEDNYENVSVLVV